MRILLVFMLASLTGCAGQFIFRKEGATNQDLRRDDTNCRVKAGQAGIRNDEFSQFIINCMAGEGWTYKGIDY